MLYIFDMGNVIIDIDFNRVFDKWAELSGTPSEEIKSRFSFGNIFQLHECGKISDIEFAELLCEEMGITLSFEDFAEGWHAIFISLRAEVIDIMERLREQGHRVVVLSNTNRLHLDYWPEHYPEIAASSDFLYLSQDLGMRKPDPEIYEYVLQSEEFDAADAIFFDDVEENVKAAEALGIRSIHVTSKDTIPEYFRTYDFSTEVK
ncbi:TPA: glucose-1-phosphatase [Providencia rettgeri]|nr:glucose-1-phosphatase [Providencia rettgeri]